MQGNETPSFGRGRQFTDVHGNLGRFYSDSEAVDDASHDEHSDVLRCTDDGRADKPVQRTKRSAGRYTTGWPAGSVPDPTTDDDRGLSTDPVRQRTRDQGAQP